MIEEVVIHQEVIYRTTYTGDSSIIDLHNKHLLDFDKGRQVSNKGGYQSNNITFGYDDLIKFIANCFLEKGVKVSLMNFWLNINKGQDYNEPHVHSTETFSAVYYHKVCCDRCPIVFSDLVPQLNGWKHSFVPKDKEIVLFDSMIPHRVLGCNNLDHERISIAFNFAILKQ